MIAETTLETTVRKSGGIGDHHRSFPAATLLQG
jgi:hypothetical protein